MLIIHCSQENNTRLATPNLAKSPPPSRNLWPVTRSENSASTPSLISASDSSKKRITEPLYLPRPSRQKNDLPTPYHLHRHTSQKTQKKTQEYSTKDCCKLPTLPSAVAASSVPLGLHSVVRQLNPDSSSSAPKRNEKQGTVQEEKELSPRSPEARQMLHRKELPEGETRNARPGVRPREGTKLDAVCGGRCRQSSSTSVRGIQPRRGTTFRVRCELASRR